MKNINNRITRVATSSPNLNLNDLLDVNTNTVTNMQALVYDSGTWYNSNIVNGFKGRIGSVIPQEGDYSLNQLSDATITSPNNNELLGYNGTDWINKYVNYYKNTIVVDAFTIFALENIYLVNSRTVTLPTCTSGDVGKRIMISCKGNGNGTVKLNPGTSLFLNGSYYTNFEMVCTGGTMELLVVDANIYSAISINGLWFSDILPGKPFTDSPLELMNLKNVSLNSPTDGQVLTYDINDGQWKNENLPGTAVTSIFGRTGDVTAQANDYSFTQISGINLTTPSIGQYLKYAGANSWVNGSIQAGDLPTITNSNLQNSSITFSSNYGSFTTSPVSLGGTTTLNIQDASASQSGAVNTGAQTFAGAKTFNSALRINSGILDSAGSAGTTNQYISSSGIWTTIPLGNIQFLNNQSVTGVLDTTYVLATSTVTLPTCGGGDIGKRIIISSGNGQQATVIVPNGIYLSYYGTNFTMNNPYGAIELIVGAANQYEIIGITGGWYSATLPKLILAYNQMVAQLADTSITSPSSGQSLVYNGTNWINTEKCIPMAEIAFCNIVTPYALTLTTQNTYYKIAPTTTLTSNNANFITPKFNMSSNGRIRYLGTDTETFHCAFSFSSAAATAGDSYRMVIYKNGVLDASTYFNIDYSSNNVYSSTAFHKVFSMVTNDYLEIFMTDISSNNKVVNFNNFNIVMMGCCATI